MEIYKRQIGYEDLGRTMDSVVTATTIFIPVLLTQNFEDIGYYTDTKNPIYEIVDFAGRWDLSNAGVNQTPCLVLNNCTASFSLNQPISFFGASDGSISVNVTNCPGPQTLSWTGPNGFTSTNATVTGLKTGTYTVKITDSNCNMTYASYFLPQPQVFSIVLESTSSQTNATTPGGCNGTASVTPQGGLAPYTYTWYNGTTIIAGPDQTTTGLTSLCAGQYTVEVKDSTPAPNGPTLVSGIFNITEPSVISGSVITTTNILCFGDTTGSITVQASGGLNVTGYSYNLTGPVTSAVTTTSTQTTFNNLPSGNYTIQIFDSAGNTTTVSQTVTTTSQIIFSLGSSATFVQSSPLLYDVGCYGSKGTIIVTPSGGVSPYQIDITKGATTVDQFSNVTTLITTVPLNTGTYTVSVTDSNNCVIPTKNIEFKQKPQLNVSVNTIPTINGYNIGCYGGTTGITVNTSYTCPSGFCFPGSANSMKYYVDNVLKTTVVGPANNVPITNILAGTHTLTVEDVNNCTTSVNFTLTEPPMTLSVTYGVISVEDGSCACGMGPDDCRQAIISINGGIAPYTITWGGSGQTGIPGTSITSDIACNGQTVTVTVTDNNGCSVGPISIVLIV